MSVSFHYDINIMVVNTWEKINLLWLTWYESWLNTVKSVWIWREVPLTEVSCVQGERHSAGLCSSEIATNQKVEIVLNHFVNCSKNSVSTHKHLGYKSYTLWRLFCIFSFLIRSMEMHPKTRIFFIFFLCTVNIQSIDRGIYIQFGTHGLDQQKKVYHI